MYFLFALLRSVGGGRKGRWSPKRRGGEAYLERIFVRFSLAKQARIEFWRLPGPSLPYSDQLSFPFSSILDTLPPLHPSPFSATKNEVGAFRPPPYINPIEAGLPPPARIADFAGALFHVAALAIAAASVVAASAVLTFVAAFVEFLLRFLRLLLVKMMITLRSQATSAVVDVAAALVTAAAAT